jgi:hypothetical protein
MPTALYHATSVPLTENPLGAIAGFETIQLIPDPNMALSPNVIIEGSSGEFSADHHISTGGTDFNYLLLNWTHIAGTELSWPVVPRLSDVMPQCNDFITIEEGCLMFKIYIWLIDSSGNWQQVYRTTTPYTATQQVQHIDLTFFDIFKSWGGMIQNEDGIQEDPDDNLIFAVGLAPTAWFLEIFETEPWREYDGSVTATISQLELTVILETEADISPRLHPRSNNSWSSQYMDICETCVLLQMELSIPWARSPIIQM